MGPVGEENADKDKPRDSKGDKQALNQRDAMEGATRKRDESRLPTRWPQGTTASQQPRQDTDQEKYGLHSSVQLPQRVFRVSIDLKKFKSIICKNSYAAHLPLRLFAAVSCFSAFLPETAWSRDARQSTPHKDWRWKKHRPGHPPANQQRGARRSRTLWSHAVHNIVRAACLHFV